MNFLCKCLILPLSIATLALAVDFGFKAGPAGSYPGAQTANGVTIAAVPFETDEQARLPFGKKNPYKHGVLPVMMVIENKGAGTLNLEGMRVELELPSGQHQEATPAADVPYLTAPRRPGVQKPIPSILTKKPKNPLGSDEIQQRAWVARMLPAGESANGFFYFQGGLRDGCKLYVTGIVEAKTRKELLYFEVPVIRQK
jgi:hypothetical protein